MIANLSWATMQMGEQLRFVILAHTGWIENPDHLDLCLEQTAGNNLEERALIELNTDAISNSFAVTFKQLIPRRYLFYEGKMSRERGQVKQTDNGTYVRIDDDLFKFCGRMLNGIYTCSFAGNLYTFQKQEDV